MMDRNRIGLFRFKNQFPKTICYMSKIVNSKNPMFLLYYGCLLNFMFLNSFSLLLNI